MKLRLFGTNRISCSNFDVIVFKVISKLFSVLVSKCPVSLKHLTAEQNRLTIVICGLFVVGISGNILG